MQIHTYVNPGFTAFISAVGVEQCDLKIFSPNNCEVSKLK